MVTRGPASTPKYVAAAVITAVIFLLGLFVGLTIEGKRVNTAQDAYTEQRIEFASSQLQYGYVQTLDSAQSCPAIYEVFYNNLKNLDKARIKLENYAQDSKINDGSFALLKREYTIEQIKYWLLSEQADKACDQDVVRVLYFYGTESECPDCAEQAFVLNYMKSLFGQRLLIYALDANLESEPMIGVLKKQFNVTSYPGIVVERSPSSNGFLSKDDLLATVCAEFDEKPEQCPDE